jgi:Transposase
MAKGNELTDFQKGEILALKGLMSQQKISVRLDIPRTTIDSFITRAETRNSIENIPRPGAPRKTSKSDDHYIVRTAECNMRIPLKELRADTISNISEQTLRRRLRETGIRKWRAVNRTLLTKTQAKRRLIWARAHHHWTVDDWRKVMYSDEAAVSKDSDPRKLRIFRR